MSYSIDSIKAEEIANQVLIDQNISSFPICPFDIGEKNGIRIEGRDLEKAGFSGCLILAENKFGIVYSNHIKHPGFERFTVAHELGHYFLPGHYEELFAGNNTQHFSKPGLKKTSPIERQADAFAAALLMPKKFFSVKMLRAGNGFQMVENLAEMFNVSLLACSNRIVSLTDEAFAVVVSKGYLVRYSILSEPLRDARIRPLKKGEKLPKGSLTLNFNEERANILKRKKAEGTALLDDWFPDAPSIEVNEDIIGLGSYGHTLTVLFTEDSVESDDEEEDSDDSPKW